MDPLTAFGLAANVLQFVEFASNLFSAAYDVHHAGASAPNLDLDLVVNDLRRLNVKLKSSLRVSLSGTVLNVDDQALEALANECIVIGDELGIRLNKLKVDPQHRSKWRTFRQVLKAMWQEDKINAMYKRLETIRSQLAFRLSVMTKHNLDALTLSQDVRFDKLDHQTALVVQKLVQNPSEIISSLDAQTIALRRRHDESDMLARELQKETLAAINGLQPPNHLSKVTSSRTPSPRSTRQVEIKPDEVITMILHMLKFRQMTARQEDVAAAHTGTFDWLVNDSTRIRQGSLFSPLLPWLETGQGCYWVSGKAGSGKSTCMKYMGINPHVQQAVRKWAGSCQLIKASFYFWRGGTPLQRSQEGLLRSLLHSILSQRRGLVQSCFPQKFDELQFGTDDDSEVIPLSEFIKPAFQLLSRIKPGTMCIFLFIDGVDEFDGDHTAISHFFMDLATSSNFKIILSSRPIAACVDAFKSCPSLRLQDLTRHDIKKYVEDTIGHHERMDQLLSDDPKEASKLTDSILSKASGVFLWIRLVVKSLLDGFRNYDRISDLQGRVDEYPAELGSLYLHMFQSLEGRYQSHAAQLLRIVVQSIAVQEERPLTVLQMSFADEVTPMRALSAPIKHMKLQERKAKCEAMEGRLRSRCWGIIEVVHKTSASASLESDSEQYYDSEIHVLHKSVLDFLAEDDVWTRLISATPKFDPNYVLMAASLMQVKTLPTANEIDRNVKHCLAYCRLLEKSTKRAQTPFVTELNRVLCMRTGDPENFRAQSAMIEWDKPDRVPYTGVASKADEFPISQRMLLLASEAGLSRYFDGLLSRALQTSSVHCDISSLIPRLVTIMTECLRRGGARFALSEEYVALIRTFLGYLTKSPHAQADSKKHAWIGTFCSIARISDVEVSWTEDEVHFEILQALLSVVRNFLACGADVNANNWREFTRWQEDFFHLGATLPQSYTFRSDKEIVASRVLLDWLNKLSDSVPDGLDDYAIVEQVVSDLKIEISARRTEHPTKIKQQEWARWLSSRQWLIDCSHHTDESTNANPWSRKRPARTMSGGPFELSPNATRKMYYDPLPEAAQPVQLRPAHDYRTLFGHFHSRDAVVSDCEKPPTYELQCEKLSWHEWLVAHYFRSCPRSATSVPHLKVIVGSFELYSQFDTERISLTTRSAYMQPEYRRVDHTRPQNTERPIPHVATQVTVQGAVFCDQKEKKERKKRSWIFSRKR